MIKECIECQNEGKYKCPACSTYNCSVNCFKGHKNSGKCHEYEMKLKNEQNIVIEDKTPRTSHLFTTADTVPLEKLEELKNSTELRNLLGNKNLRNFLKEVHSASNPGNAMKLAMMEPLFMEFADECMKIVEPPDESEN